MTIQEIVSSSHPDMAKLPGGWEIPFLEPFDDEVRGEKIRILENAFLIQNCFSDEECDILVDLFANSHIEAPVSVQGRKDQNDDRVGSVRATGWSTSLSAQFWKKMSPFFEKRMMDEKTPTDWWQVYPNLITYPKTCRDWRPIGLSPMLRFMKYRAGGQHYSHYDAGYIYENSNYRTLMSIVIYLTSNPKSGATRFVEDKQGHLPVWERDHEDWTRETEIGEVLATVQPVKGSVLAFDHRLCHDVEKFEGPEDRIIIRGDVLYEAY